MSNGFSAAYGFNVTLKFMSSLIHLPFTDYLPAFFACQNSLFPNCSQREFTLFTIWIAFFAVVALLMVIVGGEKQKLKISQNNSYQY
jgi:hypothetical protein